MSDPDNPYAAPLSAEPGPGAPGLWRIEGSELWVRHGAFFRGIDLMTGEVDPPDPVSRQVAVVGASPLTILIFVVLSAAVVGATVYERKTGHHLSFLVIFLIFVVIIRFTKRWIPTVMIGFEESRKRSKRRKWIRAAAFVMFAIGIAAPYFTTRLSPARHGFSPWIYLWVTLPPVAMGLGFSLLAAWLRRPPRCLGRVGSWFRLGRISPHAIEHLRSLAAARPVSQPTGNYLYTIDLRKFSLIAWFRALGWRPLNCLRVALAKLTHAPGFVTRQIMRMSPAFAPEEIISNAFRERISDIRQGLDPSLWHWLGWDHLKLPDLLGTIIESASFLHTDRRCCLHFTESRNSRQQPVAMTVLHSWLADGRVIRTSNERVLPSMHPGILWIRLPGASNGEVIRRHLEAMAGMDCIPLADGHEMLARLLAMQQENHRWFHGKGIFGPLEQEFDGNS